MELSFEQIKSITLGAVDLLKIGKTVRFCRMTERQAQEFEKESKGFIEKTRATSAIRLEFETNAKRIIIKTTNCKCASSRKFCSVDVFVDKSLYIHKFTKDLTITPIGDIEIPLTNDNSFVQIFLPMLSTFDISSIEISDGAYIKPVVQKRKILCYGDSITQGYDAIMPSGAYVNILARRLSAEIVSYAIGAAKFNANIIEPLKDAPDIVTVAYGTNDWRHRDRELFYNSALEFLKRIKTVHSSSRVFIILPIWRADMDNCFNGYSFSDCRDTIRSIAVDLGFEVIDIYDMIPHDERFFSDKYLHPNDLGFALYGNAVADMIEQKM